MTSSTGPRSVFCEVMAKAAGFFGNKVTITVDFGQAKRWWQQGPDPLSDPQTGKPLVFNSVIDALNHMASQGWHHVQSYTITEGQQHVYHHLLQKTF